MQQNIKWYYERKCTILPQKTNRNHLKFNGPSHTYTVLLLAFCKLKMLTLTLVHLVPWNWKFQWWKHSWISWVESETRLQNCSPMISFPRNVYLKKLSFWAEFNPYNETCTPSKFSATRWLEVPLWASIMIPQLTYMNVGFLSPLRCEIMCLFRW